MRSHSLVLMSPVADYAVWVHIPALLVLLNLLDSCFTLTWVQLGHAEEANWVMRALLQGGGPVAFAVSKMLLVAIGALVLAKQRRRLLARAGLSAMALVYIAVVAYHVSFWVALNQTS